ncbi:hypothetical protein ZWY2020_020329 [Hordeum vulgare]|nr:hypothetical protein ZWY2020_020329 [Hordeum vulgare]
MPPFNIDPPMEKLNWGAKYPKPIPEVAQIGAYFDSLKDRGLLGRDLLTTMVSRRILPLQRRPHLVCQMSGRFDPCRTSTKSFIASAMARESVIFFSRSPNPLCRCSRSCTHSIRLPAEVVTSDALEIEDEGMIESRSSASKGLEDALESDGTVPSGEHLKPSIVDWTDNDETTSSLSDAVFEEDYDGVEEVTSPPLTCGRRHKAEAAGLGEAAQRKGKATTSTPAPKEAEDVEEDTASAVERAGWAAADAAQKELEEQSARRWDAVVENMAEGQSRPSRSEKPAERRTKARHDPSTRARTDESASEAAPRRAQRTEAAKPSEPDASALVDLEEIPESPEAEVTANALELNLDAPNVALDAPKVIMDAPDAANPPHAVETAPTGTSAEPAAIPTPGDGTIVVNNRGLTAPGASPKPGAGP